MMKFITSYSGINCFGVIAYCFDVYNDQCHGNIELFLDHWKEFLIFFQSEMKKTLWQEGTRTSIDDRLRILEVSFVFSIEKLFLVTAVRVSVRIP